MKRFIKRISNFRTIKNQLKIAFSLLLLYPLQLLPTERESGTLIVTYQIEDKRLKVEKIHFWLINQEGERSLYPKKNTSAPSSSVEQTVVITDLPVGNYCIEFLIPNKDNAFEDPSPKKLELTNGSVIKIDQFIHLKNSKNSSEHVELALNTEVKKTTSPLQHFSPPPLPVFSLPLPSASIPIKPVQFNLNINLATGWKLMREGELIHSGSGSIHQLHIPPGKGYYLLPQEMAGYQFRLTPENPFDLTPGQIFHVSIDYQQEMGCLEIKGRWTETEKKINLKLIKVDEKKLILETKLHPIYGQMNWQSHLLPVGEYLAIFQNIDSNTIIEQQKVFIEKNKMVKLKFPLNAQATLPHPSGSLEVFSNISQALYTIIDRNGIIYAQGQSLNHFFDSIPIGDYELQFSSTDPRLFIPPLPVSIQIKEKQTSTIKGHYIKKGRLTVGSNVDQFRVSIRHLSQNEEIVQKETIHKTTNYYLPEGEYEVTYEPTTPETPSKSVKLTLSSTIPQTIYHTYQAKSPDSDRSSSFKQKSKIFISTNLTESSYTLYKIDKENAKIPIEKHVKQTASISIEPNEAYELVFDEVPNFISPASILIATEGLEEKEVIAEYLPSDLFVTVDQQKNRTSESPNSEEALPSYEIATYPVTNRQYANWLSEALKQKKVSQDPIHPGQIVNEEGFLICKTVEADPLSQISYNINLNDRAFLPILGKESHPVINVTWYGASLYCHDKGYELPSEELWELAAKGDKSFPNGGYKYGCSTNQIEPSLANYKEVEAPLGLIQVLTTPVGFYDGKHHLPSKGRHLVGIKTQDAKSPYGCYDMSGNVWEWVSTDEVRNGGSNKKIVKGGSYDNLKESLDISKRLVLPPHHCDIYTGFRVARPHQ